MAVATDAPPVQFRSFCVLKHAAVPFNETEVSSSQSAPFQGMKMLLPASAGHQVAYLLRQSKVMAVHLASSGEEPDDIDLGVGGNAVLGTGYSGDNGQALLFSLIHGLVTLNPTQITLDEHHSRYSFFTTKEEEKNTGFIKRFTQLFIRFPFKQKKYLLLYKKNIRSTLTSN